jgi:hypothetical protein
MREKPAIWRHGLAAKTAVEKPFQLFKVFQPTIGDRLLSRCFRKPWSKNHTEDVARSREKNAVVDAPAPKTQWN